MNTKLVVERKKSSYAWMAFSHAAFAGILFPLFVGYTLSIVLALLYPIIGLTLPPSDTLLGVVVGLCLSLLATAVGVYISARSLEKRYIIDNATKITNYAMLLLVLFWVIQWFWTFHFDIVAVPLQLIVFYLMSGLMLKKDTTSIVQ